MKTRDSLGNPRVEAVVQEKVEQAAQSLLEESGLTVHPTQPAPFDQEGYASVIGFSADGVRGTLVLIMDTQALEASTPPGVEVDPHDWIGETLNQLMGRAKNRIGNHGLLLMMSTPVVLAGCDFRLFSSTRGRSVHWEFASEEHRVQVSLQLAVADWVEVSDEEAEDNTSMEEGDFLFL